MYLLEGNMGAGKSTLLKIIQEHLPELQVVFEPVNSWHDDNHGESLLSHFYEDQYRWSYTMEKQALITRVREYLKEQEHNRYNKVMERSIYSGYYCFAKNGYLQGVMSDVEWRAYNTWFEFLIRKKCHAPLGFIYLKSTPEICFERMNRRKRPGEDSVPLEYLRQLHTMHEEFLAEKKGIFAELKHVPVLTLDVTEEFADNPELIQQFLNSIKQFTSSQNKHAEFYYPQTLFKLKNIQ